MFSAMIACREDEHYERFIRFSLKYRNEMTPPYSMPVATHLLSDQILQAYTILGLDINNDVVGYLTYYYGQSEDHPQSPYDVVIELLHIHKDFRLTFAFLQGFDFLIQQIEDSGYEVDRVLFKAYSKSDYLCRLYSKFAKKVSQIEGEFGKFDVYSVAFKEFSRYIYGKRSRLLRKGGASNDLPLHSLPNGFGA